MYSHARPPTQPSQTSKLDIRPLWISTCELRGAREWQYQVRGSVDRIHSVVHGPGLNEADLLLEEKKSSSPVFYVLLFFSPL